MLNNTFAVNHFARARSPLSGCKGSLLANVYKLDRNVNVRRQDHTNKCWIKRTKFVSPHAFHLTLMLQYIKDQKRAEWMNEIRGVETERIFIVDCQVGWWVVRPGAWLTIDMDVRACEHFLWAETDICIDQLCFIITSITSSHTGSRTRNIWNMLLSLTGRGRAPPPRYHQITSSCLP